MVVLIKRKVEDSFLSAENSGKNMPSKGTQIRSYNGIGDMTALYRKEIPDHIRSRRFLIVLGLILLTSCTSVCGALTGLSNAVASDSSYIFLKLFTLNGSSIPSFTSFIALLGPFVGPSLGFDAINSGRSEGTSSRLVAQPIYRDTVMDGKFLTGATIIFLVAFSMGLVVGSIGLSVTGVPPSTEEAGRVLVLLFFTSVYICFQLALSILCSVLCRHAAISAVIVVALWAFFALFMALVVSIVADVLYPMRQAASAGQILDNYSCQMSLSRLSPYYFYSETVSAIMNPMVRSTNIVLLQWLSGIVSGYLSLRRSCLLVWPYLTGLLALTAVVFAAPYISFMRREIRSRQKSGTGL